MLSDGHCLFRAVDHQLEARGLNSANFLHAEGGATPPALVGFQALRALCASKLRACPEDFIPFLDLESLPGDEGDASAAFERYCMRVESSADWGGHPELLALARGLGISLRVHSAEAPNPLVVGWEEFGTSGGPPLELTYHRHFYALGEHYNSTISSK